jgi:hypothetical protein
VQAVVVRLIPHQDRDDQFELLRSRLGAALTAAAGDAGLDRPGALAGVVMVLRSVTGCLHEAASAAAVRRWAREQREGKRW